MSPSKILFFLCLSFVFGIFLEFIFKLPQIFIWGFLLLDFTAIIIFILIQKDILVIFGFCLLALIIGILRMQISEFNIANNILSQFNGKGQVVLTGVINDAPDIRTASQKLTVRVGNGEVLITTGNDVEYHYLDKIKVKGKLETPGIIDDFNYTNYLLKDGIYSVMSFPKIQIVSQKHQYSVLSFVYEKILFLKSKLEESLRDNFSPTQGLILDGIIFGNNKNMTQDLRNELNNTGLRFLTAISGVHIVILSAILISLLLFLGLRRSYAFLLSIILIWFYVVITGFTASGTRAAIMGSIFILSGVLGRQNTSSRTVVLAAALMTMQNPLLLIYDIGFQLSFMACLGIIYLKPLMSYLFKIIFRDNFREFSEIISITLTAQIFTLPLMIYNFGTIPFVAPITNILILPVMPLILAFGFLFAIFASVSNIVGWIFYVPCWILTAYFIKIMDFFSQPWMEKSITDVSWIWILFAYLIIGFITLFLNKKYKKFF